LRRGGRGAGTWIDERAGVFWRRSSDGPELNVRVSKQGGGSRAGYLGETAGGGSMFVGSAFGEEVMDDREARNAGKGTA